MVFEDNGACVTITRVLIYQKFCPETEVDFARFPKTIAHGGPVQLSAGECVSNAVSNGTPRRVCSALGLWDEKQSGSPCLCAEGYEPDPLASSTCHRESPFGPFN